MLIPYQLLGGGTSEKPLIIKRMQRGESLRMPGDENAYSIMQHPVLEGTTVFP